MSASTDSAGTGTQEPQFPRHGLVSITRFTYLFARGGALVTGHADFFFFVGRPSRVKPGLCSCAIPRTTVQPRARAGSA
jgi:hypothetical protein